ncbi:type II secretion system protein N [Xanthomonas sp. 3075]|uniref:type II secretion system protein N n=1 Tax=Xanthomonas sp. 3075 TaxID=3035315 RepID=UPI001607CFBC|nr:type II secretion system protein N [Xanthomonas sp. 3075]MBB4131215.1 general secretion pathway protein N [Xanthomonas sp. 3075]
MNVVRWMLLVLALLIGAVIATLPLRWVLPTRDLPFSALDVQGSVWNGTLRAVTWNTMELGDVGVRLHPLPLLRGERKLQLSSASAHLVALQGARHGVEQANGRLLLRKPGGVTLMDVSIDLRDVRALFDSTRCMQAGGDVAVQLLPNERGEAVGLLPLRLRGSPQCVDAAVVLALMPDGGVPEGMQLSAELRLQRDGRWQLQSRVDPGQDAALAMGLQLLGFAATPERMLVRTDQGQLY